MSRKFLLVCGVLSSLVYLAMDVLGALRWDGYSYVDQTISELAALGAPSRPIALALGTLYNLLLILFAAGVAASAEGSRGLRTAAAALAGIAATGLIAAFFPIGMRGGAWTINETVHVTLTSIGVLLIVVAMYCSANAAGPRFFLYSMVSLAVMLLFGALAGASGQSLADNLPTPWMGVTERLCIFSYLGWIGVLAAVLMRPSTRRMQFADGMLR